MAGSERERWNKKYQRWGNESPDPLPSLTRIKPVLLTQLREAGPDPDDPAGGGGCLALDIACGSGRNAVFLAILGYRVLAVDISDVALNYLDARAKNLGLGIQTRQVNLADFEPPSETFDLAVVTYFLDRHLWPRLSGALRPGGMLFIETYTEDRHFPAGRMSDFVLRKGELETAFPTLNTVLYEEDGTEGVARLLARRA